MRGKVCAAFGCSNYEVEKNARSFFRFPRDKNMCDLWVLKCHRSDLDKVYKKEGTLRLYKNYKICSDHFQASDFKIPRLYSQGFVCCYGKNNGSTRCLTSFVEAINDLLENLGELLVCEDVAQDVTELRLCNEARCGFVVVVMAVFWMTEVVPLPVTSLLPVVLFPLLGVLDTDHVCIAYLKETNMMFIGGLIVAIAVENCNLHKRIALRTILIIGTSPKRLMLGFMLTTMCLSMWISNTATTAMMVPIVQAVVDELKANDLEARRSSQVVAVADSEEASGAFDPETRRKSIAVKPAKGEAEKASRPDKETICYYLGVAYASNLGGAGTLTGTGTNLTFKGIFDSVFPDGDGVNFASWMIFNIPLMLINVGAAWLWLQILYMGLFRKKNHSDMSKEKVQTVKELISQKYKELGPMTFHEGCTLAIFVGVVLLWFFRKPEFIPGWAEYVTSVEIQDATPVMLAVFLLFVLPSNLDFLRFNSNERRSCTVAPALLHWKMVHEKVPWGLVLLLGGGFAMAAASKESGLSKLLGQELVALQVLPTPLILIIICTATTFLTEVSSNTAIANIVLPVLAEMAIAMKIHPLYFMMPAVLCCSYAFMLPVATPPNAIVLAASNMKSREMMKAGIVMNIICLVILCVLFPTLGSYIYNLYDFPEYANHHVDITDISGNASHL